MMSAAMKFFQLTTFKSLPNEHSCKVGKDECLYECYQNFDEINKDGEPK